jgi:putative transposase
MKASKFSDAQKAFILKQGNDGVPVAEICRKAGISQATYFNWKERYDGMQPPEMRRLKQLEDENSKLKKIARGPVAGSRDAPGRHPPKTVRPARKRELTMAVCDEWGVSIRRACSVLNSIVRPTYKSRRREQAGVEARIKGICQTRVRYGYRRVRVLLRREGSLPEHAQSRFERSSSFVRVRALDRPCSEAARP